MYQGRGQTVAYGSEFMAASTASEHIIDLQCTLQIIGILLDGPN